MSSGKNLHGLPWRVVSSTPDGSIVVLIASFPFSTVGIKGVCTPFISSACTKICNTST